MKKKIIALFITITMIGSYFTPINSNGKELNLNYDAPILTTKINKQITTAILPGRNMIIHKKINLNFNPNNITEPSNATSSQLDKILENTGLRGLGSSYIEAERVYGINAFAMIGLTANESGWGKSKIALEKNNISGFSAYNSNPGKLSRGFTSFNHCIMRTAEVLKADYLTKKGKYYNGLATRDVNKMYCALDSGGTDYRWSGLVNKIARESLNKVNKK